MKISLDQPIAVSAEEAQAAYLDPAFYTTLGELSGISAPEVRSFSQSPDHARIVLGYRFSGQLNGPATKILDTSKLTWSQVTDVDLAARRSEVRMVTDNYQGLLSFEGWYELRTVSEHECSQHFEGDLVVHLPILGPLAERALGGSIRQNMAETAHLIERYVASKDEGAGGAAGAGGATGAEAGAEPGAEGATGAPEAPEAGAKSASAATGPGQTKPSEPKPDDSSA
jgi:hypothetical protein